MWSRRTQRTTLSALTVQSLRRPRKRTRFASVPLHNRAIPTLMNVTTTPSIPTLPAHPSEGTNAPRKLPSAGKSHWNHERKTPTQLTPMAPDTLRRAIKRKATSCRDPKLNSNRIGSSSRMQTNPSLSTIDKNQALKTPLETPNSQSSNAMTSWRTHRSPLGITIHDLSSRREGKQRSSRPSCN